VTKGGNGSYPKGRKGRKNQGSRGLLHRGKEKLPEVGGGTLLGEEAGGGDRKNAKKE